MSISQPQCPVCHNALIRSTTENLDVWDCASGHGNAISTTEASHRIQDDEMALLMGGAAQGDLSERACPGCAATMRSVEITVDDDEDTNQEAEGRVVICTLRAEVCQECLFVWLDRGELDLLPMDLPNPKFHATQEQQEVLDEIAAKYREAVEEDYAERDRNDFTERLYKRFFKDRVFISRR
jgi:Zn-finger nucleic acid-binding protein